MNSIDLPLATDKRSCDAGSTSNGCESPCNAGCQNAREKSQGSRVTELKTCGDGSVGSSNALLPTPEHVLSTLEQDGSRRWLRPRLSRGMLWKWRRSVAYALMVVFVAIPHLRIAGKPPILLDIGQREFTVFGLTFLPTDTLLLALFMVSVFLTIVLLTAIVGRAWCGWACPQTVYMEFLFRPIDRWFEGTMGKGGKPKRSVTGWRAVSRFLVYLALSMMLAHTFLAYFVGTDRLATWIVGSPGDHPLAFLVMAATTGLMLFDFLFFREQLCTIACPYGRFQSVMLDEQSLIVGYDQNRGEPRAKGKRVAGDGRGDCVDCGQCSVVCPTGIDIRDGLQMECINCTQCIDACDAVMDRIGKPRGLIRFSSQASLGGQQRRRIRARTIIYPVLLVATLTGLGFAVLSKTTFDARVLRSRGAPFTIPAPGRITNTFSIRLVNRTSERQQYQFSFQDPALNLEVIDETRLLLDAGQTTLVPIAVHFHPELTLEGGSRRVTLDIQDSSENSKQLSFRVLGPRQ